MTTKSGSTTASQRAKSLRAELKKAGLAGFIIPRQDEFQGEYVAAYAERLQWLTGFAGSWGVAILAQRKAAIFVDGRYTIQVRRQADTKIFEPHHLIEDPPQKWIAANFQKGDRIGFDPWVTAIADARKFAEAAKSIGASLVAVARNPIDAIWKDQPPRPNGGVSAHAPKFAGVSAKDKLSQVSAALAKQKADAAFLGDPASVCWLLNIRGTDVPYTPFVLAYAIVKRKGKAELFVDPARLAPEARKALQSVAVVRKPDELAKALQSLGKAKQTVSLDPSFAPEGARLALAKAGARIIEATDPCTLPRACKNATEQQGARDAQRRDGAALSRFLCWFAATAGNGSHTELTAADKLKEFREATGELRDLSFEAISASGPHSALPHYHLKPGAERAINPGDIYLIDSGGQYSDGTTDVTRTTVVGTPTEEMRDRFTRVLKGMIGISLLRFPKGTTGAHIDVIARNALWKAGLDYDHGTGHGVGSYLSVHEGPARISKTSHVVMEPGMILSNEPGYYRLDHFGIRIENLLIVSAPSSIEGGERDMMSFETLTLAPIDRNLINAHLLTREELHWFDAYHGRVLRELSPLVDDTTKAWLERACAPL